MSVSMKNWKPGLVMPQGRITQHLQPNVGVLTLCFFLNSLSCKASIFECRVKNNYIFQNTFEVDLEINISRLWSCNFQVLLTVCFAGWHICEEQEAEVLTHRKGQVQAGEETLGELRIKTGIVQTEVAEGHEEPRGRVQSDAESPYVRLGAETYRGTDRWQVIGNLETHKHTQFCFCANISRHGVRGGFKVWRERLPDSASPWNRQNEKQRIWRHMSPAQTEADTPFLQCMRQRTPAGRAPSHGQICSSLVSSWSAVV